MVHVDMTRPDREFAVGINLWQIDTAELATSSGGDQMLKIRLSCIDKDSQAFDNIMLSGPGWGIGKRKLAALLPPGFVGDLDPLELYSRRIWVSTGIEAYNGKDRLKVMIDDLKHAGYQREEDVPPGCTPPADDAVPF